MLGSLTTEGAELEETQRPLRRGLQLEGTGARQLPLLRCWGHLPTDAGMAKMGEA